MDVLWPNSAEWSAMPPLGCSHSQCHESYSCAAPACMPTPSDPMLAVPQVRNAHVASSDMTLRCLGNHAPLATIAWRLVLLQLATTRLRCDPHHGCATGMSRTYDEPSHSQLRLHITTGTDSHPSTALCRAHL
eukprot:450859-Amphidinium_carterae.1